MVKIGLWVALLAGAALFAGLLAVRGVDDVLAAFATAGWGLALVAMLYAGALVVAGLAWASLFRPPPPRLPGVLVLRWIAFSVNQLLPVAQLGGEVLRARLLAHRGVDAPTAGASVVVDMTLGLASQALFTLAGVALLALAGGAVGLGAGIALIAAVAAMALVFLRVQRRGFFSRLAGLVEKAAGGRDLTRVTGGAAALDAAVLAIYRRPGRIFAGFLGRLAVWVLFALETWLIFHLIGHPISFTDALIIEALVQAVRTAGFLVPGALGIQEGGYLVFAAAVGAPADLGLAVSLIKRARDLMLGLPGLAVWQAGEVARLRRRSAGAGDRAAVGGEQVAARGIEVDAD